MFQKIIGIAVIGGGVVLLITGIRAADSFASSVSKFFTGSPTDSAVWMSIGGVVCILAGAAMTWRAGSSARL